MNNSNIKYIIAIIILAPALGAIINGFFGKKIKSTKIINIITISLIILSCILSIISAYNIYIYKKIYIITYYNWISFPHLGMKISFILDKMSTFMMIIVTFISTLVQVYSLGYMQEEKNGYTRFFSYISAFTSSMLILIISNNLLLLFFGWEGVGLFSYLLIGYYFEKSPANEASFKAFIINRIGDLGFLLGIITIIYYCHSIEYNVIFNTIQKINNHQIISFLGIDFNPITLICILLFTGAMGKSAQFPLHTWLEGSMEGPTPISALIHSATMVTAGIFMIARFSPIFIQSSTALSYIMIIGAITSLSMGLVATVQTNIKHVIAYSTLSQLGYMMVAEGSSAFSIGMFHLITHAIFKSLLFLTAGTVIIALNHEQDIRKMGGLLRKMPTTYICMLVGGGTLAALPPLSGFFSKELIIESVQITPLAYHKFAYYLVILCVFVTAFYTFRMIFLIFHKKTSKSNKKIKRISLKMFLPLIILSILSIFTGMILFTPLLHSKLFGDTISQYNIENTTIIQILTQQNFTKNIYHYIAYQITNITLWLTILGIISTYILYVKRPKLPEILFKKYKYLRIFHYILAKKYFIDELYHIVFVKGILSLSKKLYSLIETYIINKIIIDGAAKTIYSISKKLNKLQYSYISNYTIIFLITIIILITWSIF